MTGVKPSPKSWTLLWVLLVACACAPVSPRKFPHVESNIPLAPADQVDLLEVLAEAFPDSPIDSIIVDIRPASPSVAFAYFTPVRVDSTTWTFRRALAREVRSGEARPEGARRYGSWYTVPDRVRTETKQRFPLDSGIIFARVAGLSHEEALRLLRAVERHAYSYAGFADDLDDALPPMESVVAVTSWDRGYLAVQVRAQGGVVGHLFTWQDGHLLLLPMRFVRQ